MRRKVRASGADLIVRLAMLIFASMLAGCATPTTQLPTVSSAVVEEEQRRQAVMAMEAQVSRNDRLERLAFPLLKSNVALCGKRVRELFGFSLRSKDIYHPEWRDAAAEVLALSSTDFTVRVVPGSPAHAHGLRNGDVVVAIDGTPLRKTPQRTARAAQRELAKVMKVFDKAKADGVVDFALRDGAATRTVTLREPAKVCDVVVQLTASGDINAFTDGKSIYITEGMMRFAESDEELQTVIAHELAHITEGHVAKQQRNALGGAILGAVVSAAVTAGTGIYTDVTADAAAAARMAFSPAFEHEADYVGMYMLANAGVNTDGVAHFWRRMAVEHPSAIFVKTSHPTTAERFQALGIATREIAAKKAAAAPLVPNRRQ